VQDRLVGVLDLESTELDAFSEEVEHVLTALAAWIAIALENARLFERVAREERRLEEDLATAREIQRGLLPGGAPRMPGLEIGVAYRPARELGGDFYDFLPLGPGRFALAIGDVAGKATAAALYGSLAIGLLRGGILPAGDEPARLLSELNLQLQLPRVRNRFLTLGVGVYEHPSHTLTFANAGMPWPTLVRGGGAGAWRADGFPLGVLPEVRYDQHRLRLEPGDVLAFCSDGVLDGLGVEGERFGERALEATLCRLAGEPAQVVAQGLLAAAAAFDADPHSPILDDRTVVVLRRTEREGGNAKGGAGGTALERDVVLRAT
jgi:sigma-B regulation protein RsbU (phosphoserine phosphatase)